MSYKYWLVFGSLGLGAAQSVACSGEFRSCTETRTCKPMGGAAGLGGAAGSGTSGELGAGRGGSGGREEQPGEGGSAGADAEGGEAGVATGDAGSGGVGGDAGEETKLVIATPALDNGKTYVPYAGKIKASGAAKYTWSITSGALPAGLALQGLKTDTVTIAGTPTQAGQYPITLSVTDGVATETLDVTVSVTHPALFLSDLVTAGVNELFVAKIGAATAEAPERLSASLPAGGSVTSYAWSPDGSKVMYLAKQSAAGATELWVASLDAPGIAQRVSAIGRTASNMVWLRAGNVAAYATNTGEAYLVDLSGTTPGTSILAVPGATGPGGLVPSPNGTSVAIGTSAYDNTAHVTFTSINYVTWTDGALKSVPLFQNEYANGRMQFSFDGRLGLEDYHDGSRWWDLVSTSPTAVELGGVFNAPSWSPNAEALLFRNENGSPSVYRGVYENGTFTSTLLVPYSSSCIFPGNGPWSPDGKHALFVCDKDLRGIRGAITATAGADFSLLPSGFFSNTFTNVQSYGWSPDSKWVALRADRDTDGQFDLQLIRWSAPGIAFKPHTNVAAPGVTTWAFAQTSEFVAFVGTIAPQNNAGLYLSKLPASGAPTTGMLVSAQDTSVVQDDINWLPGSRVITYRATVSSTTQLFALPVAADGTAGTPVPISGASGSGVTDYQLAPAR